MWYAKWQLIEGGALPYRDFNFSYPPLALALFIIPGLASGTAEGFYAVFSAQMLAIAWLTVLLVSRTASRMGLDGFRAAALYFIVLLMYSTELTKKLDIAAAAAVLSAMWLWLSGRRTGSYLMLVLGALVKIYPVFLIPVFLMASYLAPGGDRRIGILKGIAAAAGLGVAAVLMMLAAGVPMSGLSEAFLSQAGRSFQAESVPGNITHLLGLLGIFDYGVAESAHTYIITQGPLAGLRDGWIWAVAVMCILSYIAVWVFGKRSSAGGPARVLALGSCLTVLAVLLSYMVFSTQYMLWIVTLLPFVIMGEKGPSARLRMQAAYLALFPVLLPLMAWYLFGIGEAAAALSVLVRNLLLLWFALRIISMLSGRRPAFPRRQ